MILVPTRLEILKVDIKPIFKLYLHEWQPNTTVSFTDDFLILVRLTEHSFDGGMTHVVKKIKFVSKLLMVNSAKRIDKLSYVLRLSILIMQKMVELYFVELEVKAAIYNHFYLEESQRNTFMNNIETTSYEIDPQSLPSSIKLFNRAVGTSANKYPKSLNDMVSIDRELNAYIDHENRRIGDTYNRDTISKYFRENQEEEEDRDGVVVDQDIQVHEPLDIEDDQSTLYKTVPKKRLPFSRPRQSKKCRLVPSLDITKPIPFRIFFERKDSIHSNLYNYFRVARDNSLNRLKRTIFTNQVDNDTQVVVDIDTKLE